MLISISNSWRQPQFHGVRICSPSQQSSTDVCMCRELLGRILWFLCLLLSRTIRLSVDLDKTIPEVICLFEKISDDWLDRPATVQRMIRRYYRFLHLKAQYPSNLLLIPTLDVETIWQTHLARPEVYRNDCIRLFGRVIDHGLVLNEIEQFLKKQAFLETCRLYEEHFQESYCTLPSDMPNWETLPIRKKISLRSKNQFGLESYSYWDKTSFQFDASCCEEYDNPFSFNELDLLRTCQWFRSYPAFRLGMQRKTNRSLEGVNKLDASQITLMKKSYERFLYFAAKYSPQMAGDWLCSTFAIDLVGRAHQQEPVQYSTDCQKFVGYRMDHSRETNRTKKMDDLWKAEFNCELETDHLYRTYIDYLTTDLIFF